MICRTRKCSSFFQINGAFHVGQFKRSSCVLGERNCPDLHRLGSAYSEASLAWFPWGGRAEQDCSSHAGKREDWWWIERAGEIDRQCLRASAWPVWLTCRCRVEKESTCQTNQGAVTAESIFFTTVRLLDGIILSSSFVCFRSLSLRDETLLGCMVYEGFIFFGIMMMIAFLLWGS